MKGYNSDIELNFLIAGHTKFQCDQIFGIFKKRFRRTLVSGIDDIVKVGKNSLYIKLIWSQRTVFSYDCIGTLFRCARIIAI